ncbi:MAG: WD40 repeat domain-containing protein [Anaerolineae bacterium]|nr:WD40 repeat domain-containing protein [Anaerolineae bacterium]
MRRLRVFVPLLLVTLAILAIGRVALGQDGPTASFAVQQQIGQVSPRGVQYDPNFDQIAWVDAQGRLVLVDAATFEVRHVLYERGSYSVYQFSHDGRWLAVGIDRRVELWNTQTGELTVTAEPEEALRIQAPLQFADDDKLLLITAVVPAPAALRRSENDTSNLPYLWDLPAARDEAPTTLPRYFELYTFYDYRNGFVLGANDKVIAALPRRLQVMDIADQNLPVLAEIPSERFERDPISIWYSLRDDYMYALPKDSNNFWQVDTATGNVFEIPLGRDLNYADIRSLGALQLADQARIVGQPGSRQNNSFLNLVLGSDYRRAYNYHPTTVMILDIVEPITVDDRRKGFLLYMIDEQTGRAVIEALRPVDTVQMALSPDSVHLAVRRASGDQPIEIYNLDTGALERAIIPAIPDPEGRDLLAYDASGDVILSGFQRFDATTGAVLHEDLRYHPGFEQYFFSQDSQSLVTLTGSEWWQWDLAHGDVIRRETLRLRGTLLEISPDGHRFMTQLDPSEGPGIEVVDIGTGERHTVLFETLPGRPLYQVIPSPDWEHYLVTYDANSYGPHYPGNEVAVYSLRDGLRWFLAGDDLPHPEAQSYGWLDNTTAYIYGENLGGPTSPARVYGVDYDGSGLPACLVTAFPGEWTRWRDLWEKLQLTMQADRLNELALRLCGVLPGTTDDIEAVFHPTLTPTSPPVTATPAVIAGVPICLTSRFPRQAAEYAAIWREMSAGLTPEETAELEVLLCEGLSQSSGSSDPQAGDAPENTVQVTTIDVITGIRAAGGYLPPGVQPASRSIDLVAEEFRRSTNRQPTDPVLSPDGTLLAVRTTQNHVTVYRLVTPYETLAANATATAAPRAEEEIQYISMRPAPTQPLDRAGLPRPTLTPTITPTPPSPADQSANLPRAGEVEMLGETDMRYTAAVPPPGYAASGDLLVRVYGDDRMLWRLEAATGWLHPDERLPTCYLDTEFGCALSDDQNWLVRGQTVSRADGSNPVYLADVHGVPLALEGANWVGPHLLEYQYQDYRLDVSRDPITLLRYFDPVAETISDPVRPPEPITINGLRTEILETQPNNGSVAVVRIRFNTGVNDGYKYYVYDRATGQTDYFARLAGDFDNFLQVTWNPRGHEFYYRYPDAPGDGGWYVYDTGTRQHRFLGEMPGGIWSRDGRYRTEWFTLSGEAYQERIDAGLPLPKLRVWDRETGLVRHYCIPGAGDWVYDGAPLLWSPDSRYLAFQIPLPEDGEYETVRPRALLLDIQTGSVIELPVDVAGIAGWVE